MADVSLTHPEMIKRYYMLVEICWKNGWYVGITSSTRTYQEQKSLYLLYRSNPSKYNTAANPDVSIVKSPWGWPIRGSFHMVQQDGYSHALDLHWQNCSPAQLEREANKCGLYLTVPGENWHFQWFDGGGIFEVQLPEPPPSFVANDPSGEDDDMTPVIHYPLRRQQGGNASTPIYDFTYLPADTGGQALYGFVVSSYLYIRRNGGGALEFTVYIQGVPTHYRVPEDGTTIKVPVTSEGLISIVGDVIVEAREQWRKA